jgi:uncharacterized protein YggU (UPF0235/DUF167 family)
MSQPSSWTSSEKKMGILRVFVKPGRKEAGVFPPGSEFEREKCDFVVSLKSRAEGGRANKELLELLSERFGRAEIVSGARARLKTVRVP